MTDEKKTGADIAAEADELLDKASLSWNEREIQRKIVLLDEQHARAKDLLKRELADRRVDRARLQDNVRRDEEFRRELQAEFVGQWEPHDQASWERRRFAHYFAAAINGLLANPNQGRLQGDTRHVDGQRLLDEAAAVAEKAVEIEQGREQVEASDD